MRDRVVVQPSNMPNRNVQINGGFAIRGKERAALCGVLITREMYVESLIDLSNIADDWHNQTVCRLVANLEALGVGPGNHCLVILRRRAKLIRELLYA